MGPSKKSDLHGSLLDLKVQKMHSPDKAIQPNLMPGKWVILK